MILEWFSPLTGWMIVASVVLFFLMGYDKRQAKREGRRVAEKTLFAWAICGGAVGGWLGMARFRHKTKHWYFKLGFPLLALLQIAAVVWISLP